MEGLRIANWIAFVILAIGGLNWGLIGILGFNLVEWIFGGYNVGSVIVYILVCLATIWLIISLAIFHNLYFIQSKKANSTNKSNQ